jgi:hypothetical protein
LPDAIPPRLKTRVDVEIHLPYLSPFGPSDTYASIDPFSIDLESEGIGSFYIVESMAALLRYEPRSTLIL